MTMVKTVEFPCPDDAEDVGFVYVFRNAEGRYGMRIVPSPGEKAERVLEKAHSLIRQHGQRKIIEAVQAGREKVVRPA